MLQRGSRTWKWSGETSSEAQHCRNVLNWLVVWGSFLLKRNSKSMLSTAAWMIRMNATCMNEPFFGWTKCMGSRPRAWLLWHGSLLWIHVKRAKKVKNTSATHQSLYNLIYLNSQRYNYPVCPRWTTIQWFVKRAFRGDTMYKLEMIFSGIAKFILLIRL